MAPRNRATAFSADLLAALKTIPHTGIRSWEKNWPLKQREMIDVVGLSMKGNPQLLIEVELLRDAPESNIVKIWQWLSDKELARRAVVVIQAFSKAYKTRKERRKSRAVFLGRRMQREIRSAKYIDLDFGYSPVPGGKVGGGARKRRARELARQIAAAWARTRR